MTIEESCAGIGRNKIDFSYRVRSYHHCIFTQAGHGFSVEDLSSRRQECCEADPTPGPCDTRSDARPGVPALPCAIRTARVRFPK